MTTFKRTEFEKRKECATVYVWNSGCFEVCTHLVGQSWSIGFAPVLLKLDISCWVDEDHHHADYEAYIPIFVGDDIRKWSKTRFKRFLELMRMCLDFVDADIVHRPKPQPLFVRGFAELVEGIIRGEEIRIEHFPPAAQHMATAMLNAFLCESSRGEKFGPTWRELQEAGRIFRQTHFDPPEIPAQQ